MAHFAKIDNLGNVVDVLVIDDNDCKDSNGVESESVGVEFCKSIYPDPDGIFDYKKTSYNTVGGEHANGGTPFRYNYATKGGKYDYVRQAFVPKQTYPEQTVLDTDTMQWVTPFWGRQTSDNAGNPLEFTDNSDYSTQNQKLTVIQDWDWDDTAKTYVNGDRTEKKTLTYSYDTVSAKWVKQ